MNIVQKLNFVNLFKLNNISSYSSALIKNISTSSLRHSEAQENLDENKTQSATEKELDPRIDRTRIIPVETSIKYIKSAAYKETYGDQPVWVPYRRNFKGQIPPKKTRKTCIRSGKISTGNPCPVCRDEYLILHPNNTELLKQFISPQTGEVRN
jgi:small subunit ribosomal protein S18b